MLDSLLQPLDYGFMQRALLAASLAGIACAVIGAFVVLKGMAFMGEAVAHSSLAGMAVAYLSGGNVFWGALAWAVSASLGITYISRRANLRLDTAIGIIIAGGFALGVVLVSQAVNYTADLFGFLFGNVLAASWGEVALSGGAALAVVVVVFALYKELLFAAYDSDMAEASGVPVRFVEYLLPALVAVTAVVALKTVGIMLVLALLVTPPATATLLARRLPAILALSVAVALAAVIAGLYLSFYANLPTGPSIVLVATGFFLLAFFFAPVKGLAWRGMAGASKTTGDPA